MWGRPPKRAELKFTAQRAYASTDSVLEVLNDRLDKPPSRPVSPSEYKARRGAIKNSFEPLSEATSHAQQRMDGSLETIGLRINVLEGDGDEQPTALGRCSPPVVAVALDRRRNGGRGHGLCSYGASGGHSPLAVAAAMPRGRRNMMVASAFCLLLAAYFLMMRGLQTELTIEMAGGKGGGNGGGSRGMEGSLRGARGST